MTSSEAARVPSAGGDPGGETNGTAADPAARPERRSFTADYRARVVAEYEAAPRGEKTAVLRREGLYQSQVREWTHARDAVTAGLTPKRRQHRTSTHSTEKETERLRRENRRLSTELTKSQAVVEIMGKLQGLLDAISESTGTATESSRR